MTAGQLEPRAAAAHVSSKKKDVRPCLLWYPKNNQPITLVFRPQAAERRATTVCIFSQIPFTGLTNKQLVCSHGANCIFKQTGLKPVGDFLVPL